MNGDAHNRVAALLHEAGETHADWLINLSELPEILGQRPVRSELVYMLVRLDKEYTDASPTEPWPDWYASRLLDHFSS